MTPTDVAIAFQKAAEEGDWDTFEQIIADDFAFHGPTPTPLDKRACISMHKALWGGFPDINYNLRVLSEEGNRVTGIVHITGTHNGTLIPPMHGKFVSFAPTGKRINLAEEQIIYTVRGNQITDIEVQANEHASWPGIFEQLGVESPF